MNKQERKAALELLKKRNVVAVGRGVYLEDVTVTGAIDLAIA